MQINSNIFNDMVNINDKWEYIEGPEDRDAAMDKWYDVIQHIVEQEDSHEITDAVKHGEPKSDALTSAINEELSEGLNIWLVPDNSLLATGLRQYYDYVSGGNSNYIKNFKKYARSAVNSTDVDVPDNVTGFFFATGAGYSINDELFAGVPIKRSKQSTESVGSGIPARKFINYLNNVDAAQLSKHDHATIARVAMDLSSTEDYFNKLYKQQGGNLNKIGAKSCHDDAAKLERLLQRNK